MMQPPGALIPTITSTPAPTPTPDLTTSERVLIQGIYETVCSGRLTAGTPSFASRSLAGAMATVTGHPVREYDLSPLLDRMGIHCEGRGPGRYQRPTWVLLRELPAWVRYAHETPAALLLSL